MLAPKPPVFEIRTLAFGLLMAGIGLGLGLGVGLCGTSKRWSHSKALPYLSLALLGLALVGFSRLTEYLPPWPVRLFSAAFGVHSHSIEARLQNDVDDARRGRLFACEIFAPRRAFLSPRRQPKRGPPEKNRTAALIQDIGFTAIVLAAGLALLNASTLRSFWSARH